MDDGRMKKKCGAITKRGVNNCGPKRTPPTLFLARLKRGDGDDHDDDDDDNDDVLTLVAVYITPAPPGPG